MLLASIWVRSCNVFKSGVVMSLDGSPVCYVNWDEGEPIVPIPGRTYCMRMSISSGRWQTVHLGCDYSNEEGISYYYVCKRLKGLQFLTAHSSTPNPFVFFL